jgi:predicted AAA+ superfamily ATPase
MLDAMKIQRYYETLSNFIEPNKVLVIFGPRQVGKTTLLHDYLHQTKLRYRLDNGDNLSIHQILGSRDFSKIKEYTQDCDLIAIDEAQLIPNIGACLKIMVDQIPGIRIVVTGSSSFELAGQIGEPLVGRKRTLHLFPISQMELRKMYSLFDLRQKLEESIVFGGYPEVVTSLSKPKKIRILEDIINSYLLKDILSLERVKGTKTILDLLRLLAFQVGSEVSYHELGQQLGIDSKTVARYIDLFEKSFILVSLHGYSTNLRKEIRKKNKYYFYDTGIRNALIGNFNEFSMRNDVGILWENFLFIERYKKCSYQDFFGYRYFWRTWDSHEVDLVEEWGGKITGYEFKWKQETSKQEKYWKLAYPEALFQIINQDNYLEFIL